MPKRQKILKYLRDASLAIAILIGVSFWQNRNLLSTQEKAPDFSALKLDGQIFTSGSLQGKSTLVYFFAPWCGVCRFSANNIVSLLQTLGHDRIQVIAVALDYETQAEVKKFVHEAKIEPIPIVLGDERIRSLYHIEAYPTYYGINASGTLVFRSVGYSSFVGLLLRSFFYL